MARSEVLSPIPGIFYSRSAPDAPDFKNLGDPVAVGDVIALVEVMKMFNEVHAEVAGVFSGYQAESEAEIEVGQVIAVIES